MKMPWRSILAALLAEASLHGGAGWAAGAEQAPAEVAASDLDFLDKGENRFSDGKEIDIPPPLWSPDRKLVVYTNRRGTLTVREGVNLRQVGEVKSGSSYLTTRGPWSPSGRYLFVSRKKDRDTLTYDFDNLKGGYLSNAETIVWDLQDGKEVANLGRLESIKFSPDMKHFAGNTDRGTVAVFEFGRWRKKAVFKGQAKDLGYSGSFSFSLDGRTLTMDDRGRRVPNGGLIPPWNWPDARILEGDIESERTKVTGKGFANGPTHEHAPDGRHLKSRAYSGGGNAAYELADGAWKRVEVVSNLCMGLPGGGACEPNAIAFSPAGRFAAAADSTAGVVRVWETGTWKEVALLREYRVKKEGYYSAAELVFSPDERLLAAKLTDGLIHVVDLEKGWEIGPLQVRAWGWGLDGNGRFVNTDDDKLKAYPISTEEFVEGRVMLLRDRIAAVEAEARRSQEAEAAKLKAEASGGAAEPQKSEFETQKEFEARKAALEERLRGLEAKATRAIAAKAEGLRREFDALLRRERPAAGIAVKLGTYDAEAQKFPASFEFGKAWEFQVPIPRSEAPRVKKDGLTAEVRFRHVIDDKGLSKEVSLISLKDGALGQVFRWRAEGGAAAAGEGRPALPPKLALAVSLADADKDGALAAEEKGRVSAKVSNQGAGAALGVSLELSPASSPGLAYEPRAAVGELGPGESKTVELPVEALLDAAGGPRTFTVEAAEANGFNAAPVRLTFTVRAFAPPGLAVSETGVKDANENGRAEPGELVELTLRVSNTGQGPAQDAAVSLQKADPDLFIQGEPRRALGDIPPGASRDAVFTVFSNTRFAKDLMRFDAAVTERRSRYGTSSAVEVPMNRPIEAIREVVMEGRPALPASEAPSAELKVDIDGDIPVAGQPKPDALAVIFGIERYKKAGRVSFARRDATVFKDYAVRVLGVPDDKGHLFFLTDDVTLGEFKKAFAKGGWLSRRVSADSEVFIYFAGHGAPDPGTGGAYLIPQDGDPNYAAETGFPMDDLLAFAGSLPARSTTLFLDACFSGVDRDNQPLLAQARPLVMAASFKPDPAAKNLLVFSAAKANQISSGDPDKRHGLFSYFLMKGLSGESDANKDGALTAGELRDYLKTRVSKRAGMLDREQTPEFSGDQDRVLTRYRR